MKDLITKHTGNSLLMKSVANFKSRYPTYDDFAAALAAGTLPMEFNGFNTGGITQEGTPFDTASVMADSTAALFGLEGDGATVNRALAKKGENMGGIGAYYAVCNSGFGTPVKDLTIPDFHLYTGTRLSVFFTAGHDSSNNPDAASPSIRVNGGTAYRIIAPENPDDLLGDDPFGGYHPGFDWPQYDTVDFVFTGEHWALVSKAGSSPYMFRTEYVGTGEYGENPTVVPLEGVPVVGFITDRRSYLATLIGPFSTASFKPCGYQYINSSIKPVLEGMVDLENSRLLLRGGATADYQSNFKGTTYYATFIGCITIDMWLGTVGPGRMI